MRSITPYALAILCALPTTSSALDIVINPTAALQSNAPALAAFTRAADEWESLFSDNITVTVDADVSSFGNTTTIGSTSSVILQGGHDFVINLLLADADADDSILASLPTLAQFTATLTAGDTISTNISGNKANFKALGVTGLDVTFGIADGAISFNSDFSFDYDNSNGVTVGNIDFETVALHELGHLLGFTSSVDIFDLTPDPLTGVAPRILDLFRFDASAAPSSAAEFTSFSRELRPGAAAVFSDGSTSVSLSTGKNEGDGQQASHLKDNLGLGVMDPTLAPGETVAISANDLFVFDSIGWDYVITPVPEPSTSGLLIGAALLFCANRRRA